jgi:hypothetical protein
MNPGVEGYLETYRSTQGYLKLSRSYCNFLGGIRWSGEDDLLVNRDGHAFCFFPPIADLLEGFAGAGRVIPFECVLHWIDLLQNLRGHENADVRRLRQLFHETGMVWRNAGALAAILSADVPAPPNPPPMEHVCRRLRDQAFPIRWFVARFHDVDPGPAAVPAISPECFEQLVPARLSPYSDDELRGWLQHGRGPLREAGSALARAQPLPRSLTGILAALLLRPRLAGAEAYVTRLVGALTVPPRRLAPQELPVGGYADMSTHGAVEHILPSQHALDELEFLRRFAERELLFFRREEPPTQNRREMVVLIDQGVRTWGDVRLVLAAAALALGKQAARRSQPLRLAGTSNAGLPLDPLAVDDETLGELIEASDISLNPGAALETVLQNPSEALRDVVLLTHPRNVREPDVLAAARRAGARDRLFAVTIDEDGAAAVSEIRRGTPVPVRQFRIEFERSKPPEPLRFDPSEVLAPWTGDVEPVPFPFRFGTSGKIVHFDFDYEGRWLLTVSDGGMLHLWGLNGDQREVLPRPFRDGELLKGVRTVIGVSGGYVLILINKEQPCAAHYDVVGRQCHVLNLWRGWPVRTAHYLAEIHSIRFVGTQSGPYLLDLANGKSALERQASERPGLQEALDAYNRRGPSRCEIIDRDDSDSPSRCRLLSTERYAYILDANPGTITVRQSGCEDRVFVPQADGKPLLRGAMISAAHAAGDVLALCAQLHDRSIRLLLFRGSTGALLREYRYEAKTREKPRFLLSPDGRWLARMAVVWGGHVIVENTDTPSQRIATRGGGYNNNAQIFLGERSLLIAMHETHWHLVHWTDDTVEFDYETKRGGPTGFTKPAFREATRAGLSRVRALIDAAHLTYDPGRSLATAVRDGLEFALDRYGQVPVFDSSGKLLCMFMAFRSRLAAWLPDGSRCGSEALGQGPETPGARARLAQILRNKHHARCTITGEPAAQAKGEP